MNCDGKIYSSGYGGMVGSALVRRLETGGYSRMVPREQIAALCGDLSASPEAAGE
jgi:hypothetical protein